MSRDLRQILNSIAANIVFESMENIGMSYADMIAEAETLTDAEIVAFITK